MKIRRTMQSVLALLVISLLLSLAALQALAQTPTPYPTSTPYPTQTPYPTFTPPPDSMDNIQPEDDPALGEGQIVVESDPITDTRMPDPAGGVIAGDPDVAWEISDRGFTSRYPEGMTFTLNISNSASPIETARVVWTHVPGRQTTLPATEINPDTGDLIAEWAHTDGNRPPWLEIDYWWEVTDSAGNSYRTPLVVEEYADNTREWVRAESEDVVVIAYGVPQEVLQMSIDALAQQRETFRAAWGDVLPYRPRAILMGDRAVFTEWREGISSQNVVGLTNPNWGATIQVVSSSGDLVDLAYAIVVHEVAHLYQSWFAPLAFQTGTWFNEGNATFFELNQLYDYEGRVRNMAQSGELPVLLNGAGPNPSGSGPDGIGRFGYDVGYTFFAWFVEIFGLEGHREYAQIASSASVTRNEALEMVTGMTIADIETAWREWIGADGPAPTLLPTFTPVRLASPTPFQIPSGD